MTTIVSSRSRPRGLLASALMASIASIGVGASVYGTAPSRFRRSGTNRQAADIHPMITSSPSEIKQWNAAVEQKKRDRHMRRLNRDAHAHLA